MSMEKFGVTKEIQHEDLRNEEAQLMQKMGDLMVKTAADPDVETERQKVEVRLQRVRAKLTELDLKGQ